MRPMHRALPAFHTTLDIVEPPLDPHLVAVLVERTPGVDLGKYLLCSFDTIPLHVPLVPWRAARPCKTAPTTPNHLDLMPNLALMPAPSYVAHARQFEASDTLSPTPQAARRAYTTASAIPNRSLIPGLATVSSVIDPADGPQGDTGFRRLVAMRAFGSVWFSALLCGTRRVPAIPPSEFHHLHHLTPATFPRDEFEPLSLSPRRVFVAPFMPIPTTRCSPTIANEKVITHAVHFAFPCPRTANDNYVFLAARLVFPCLRTVFHTRCLKLDANS
ncbi:hypothetical protein HYPSUDRAFT_203833 [Hypholoma sublateritium FD-334 SS-4]|uniref:Uncharacterized protein n=1 Tax=Hypholoma sublateritium (strain FD-334 SS-4) TaxID=945553 RepID=A0A0D2PK40_HYPSF|nr:hypothetical protein HYPSUDRAFT_203833 [Hypholoma sublateritium FD-334 SS-4]